MRSVVLVAGLCLVVALPFRAAPAQREQGGAIAGVVRFTGTVPPPGNPLPADGNVMLHSDLVVDPKTRGLRDVALVLEDVPPQPKVEKAAKVLVDQRDI